MPRPSFISDEQMQRWDEKIDSDPLINPHLAQNPIIREVLYAGQYLVDKLDELNCPDHLIGRMMYSAGALCFGRKDPWIVHLDMLDQFVAGTLEFDDKPSEMS